MPTIGSEIDLQFDVLSTDIKEVKSGLSTFKEETEIKTENIDADLDSLENKVNKSNTELVVEITKLKEYISKINVVSSSYYNIEDGGCIPNDPSFDNGPVFTKIFDEVGRTIFTPIVIPSKDYYVKTPVVIPGRVGMVVIGSGSGLREVSPKFRGAISRIVAANDLDCIVENRCQGIYWRGVTLSAGTAKVNRCLWIRDNDGFGLATGHGQYVSFTVQNGIVGVDISSPPAGSNASDLDFSFFRTANCETGLRTNSGQVAGLTITNYTPYQTPNALDFRAGGRFSVRGMEIVTAGTAIKIGDPGSMTGTYAFDSIGIDNAIEQDEVTLLEINCKGSGQPSNITFRNLHDSHRGPLKVKLRGGTHTKFDSCYGLKPGMFSATGRNSHLVLTDCGVAAESMAAVVDLSLPLERVEWERCYKAYDAVKGYHGVNFDDKKFGGAN